MRKTGILNTVTGSDRSNSKMGKITSRLTVKFGQSGGSKQKSSRYEFEVQWEGAIQVPSSEWRSAAM